MIDLLNEPFMAGAWTAVAMFALYITVRARLTVVAPLVAAALPMIAFYLITWHGDWPSREFAVMYSRVALLFVAVNLVAVMFGICRLLCNKYDGRE